GTRGRGTGPGRRPEPDRPLGKGGRRRRLEPPRRGRRRSARERLAPACARSHPPGARGGADRGTLRGRGARRPDGAGALAARRDRRAGGVTVALGEVTAVVLNWRTPEHAVRAVRALVDDGLPADRAYCVLRRAPVEDD